MIPTMANRPDSPKDDIKPATATEKSAEKAAVEPKPATKVAPKKKSWSNPALKAMGIPRISLPSRNWMIFWTVLASVGGGIAYDKYEQGKVRTKWMEEVKALGLQTYGTERLPRKLTIYIAPPPNDFLEESMKVFRKFIKPVLNASAIDFELYSGSRQGDIRSSVANKIRALRANKVEEAHNKEEEQKRLAYEKSWTKFFNEDVPGYFTWSKKRNTEEDVLVARQELYQPTDVLGLYQLVNTVEPKSDDQLNIDEAGGVICIGRGAYKEYVTGVHEGLLGPLEKPQALIDEEIRVKEEKQKQKEEDEKNGIKSRVDDDDDDDTADDEGEKKKRDPVVKPFITPAEYPNAALAPELDFSSTVTDSNNIPVLFEQPVYVFPVHNLLGFLTIPRKIYRYYTKRELADELGFRTTAVVYNNTRPFEFKDSLSAKEEEVDWPKKWVETGKGKNSEWVQELIVDERVIKRMRVYDHTLERK